MLSPSTAACDFPLTMEWLESAELLQLSLLRGPERTVRTTVDHNAGTAIFYAANCSHIEMVVGERCSPHAWLALVAAPTWWCRKRHRHIRHREWVHLSGRLCIQQAD